MLSAAEAVGTHEQCACPEPALSEDALLAQALIDGRRDAAPSAWRRFVPVVQTTLRRMLGSGPDLPDLTQEVFLRFFGKVRELKKLASLKPFVTAIAVRRAREEIKRRRVRRVASPFLGHTALKPSTPQANPEAREMVALLYRVMGTLDPQDQSVYALRHVEGMDLAEIACTLRISVSTVRRRLRRVAKQVDLLMNADEVFADYRGRA
jgi:RNA polymerase sigma-70 factor (ECF subfamily)